MTKEEIIHMARLYGTPVQEQNAEVEYRFTLEELGLLLSTACVIEREACAKVCETLGVHPALNVYGGGPEWYKHGKDCADAIRSRGLS